MKKKRIRILVICLVLIAGYLGWKSFSSYSRTLDANWGFSLPFKALCREIYEESDPSSFHGDGIRYHVYSYKYEDYIDLMFAWRGPEGPTIFNESYPDAVESWLDQIDVPSEWRPNYSVHDCSYWYMSQHDNSQIIIVMDQELNRLYIAESFI